MPNAIKQTTLQTTMQLSKQKTLFYQKLKLKKSRELGNGTSPHLPSGALPDSLSRRRSVIWVTCQSLPLGDANASDTTDSVEELCFGILTVLRPDNDVFLLYLACHSLYKRI